MKKANRFPGRKSALYASLFRGKRRLSAEALVPTNDLGEFRLFGLKPGRYFVSAKYKRSAHRRAGEVREDDSDDSRPDSCPSTIPIARSSEGFNDCAQSG